MRNICRAHPVDQYECLDIYLPLLEDSSPQTSLHIAQCIGSAVRNDTHRAAIIQWLPPHERQKDIRGRRGWEKHDVVHAVASGKQGAWVLRHLIVMIQRRDNKVGAVHFLTWECTDVATVYLGAGSSAGRYRSIGYGQPARRKRPHKDTHRRYGEHLTLAEPFQPTNEATTTALNLVLSHTKSRATDVQLAAALWSAYIHSYIMHTFTEVVAALPTSSVLRRAITLVPWIKQQHSRSSTSSTASLPRHQSNYNTRSRHATPSVRKGPLSHRA